MTLAEWLTWGRDIAMGALFVLIWFIGRERTAIENQFKEIRAALATTSMEALRKVFVSSERINDLLRESHDDHAAIWREIIRLRDKG